MNLFSLYRDIQFCYCLKCYSAGLRRTGSRSVVRQVNAKMTRQPRFSHFGMFVQLITQPIGYSFS